MTDDAPPPRRKGLFSAVAAAMSSKDSTASPAVVTSPPPAPMRRIVPHEMQCGPSLVIAAEAFAKHAADTSGWAYWVIWHGLCAIPASDQWMLFTPWGWEELFRRLCFFEHDYETPIH